MKENTPSLGDLVLQYDADKVALWRHNSQPTAYVSLFRGDEKVYHKNFEGFSQKNLMTTRYTVALGACVRYMRDDGRLVTDMWTGVTDDERAALNLPWNVFSGVLEWVKDGDCSRLTIDLAACDIVPHESTLRTSKHWVACFNVVILDPDGWDRKNYDESFNYEKINLQEFFARLRDSSCMNLTYAARTLHKTGTVDKIDHSPKTNRKVRADLGGVLNLVEYAHAPMSDNTIGVNYITYTNKSG